MARHQLEQLQDLGYQLFSAFEIEFLLVDLKTLEPVFHQNGVLFANSLQNRMDPILLDIAGHLELMGVEVEGLHSEYGPGQFEVILKPQVGIRIADNVIMAKDCVREVARQHGVKAIFMTNNGMRVSNGLHYNHSLRQKGDNINVFSDVADTHGLSDLCRSWIAGLIHHYRALNALCSPTFNCYRRVNKARTPSISDWGIDSRDASYRVKNSTPDMTYIESRLPSGSANPYLVLAATVASGIDGIVNNLPCPPPIQMPTSLPNPYKEVESSKIPLTLAEALEALQTDSAIVDSMGRDFITWFVLLKECEIKHITGCDVSLTEEQIFAKEQDLYMDLI